MGKAEKNELEWVERLAKTMADFELHRVEFETEDVSLTLRSAKVHREQPAPVAEADHAEPEVEEADVVLVRSKDVGLFRPDGQLKAGSLISKGQKLATIEAVSVEHDLVSEYDGTLVEVVAQEGDPVEYGQPLFVLSESEG